METRSIDKQINSLLFIQDIKREVLIPGSSVTSDVAVCCLGCHNPLYFRQCWHLCEDVSLPQAQWPP